MVGVDAKRISSEAFVEDIYVKLRGVEKTFSSRRGNFTALKKIDLEIYSGEFISVVGPSGCGKSTMLKCIAGPRSGNEGLNKYSQRAG